MFNVESLIKVDANGLIHFCKTVQARHGKIEVGYVNCQSKPAFWLHETNPSIVKPNYLWKSGSQVPSMSIEKVNS